MNDFETFSKYFLYDEVLDVVFNRVSRRGVGAFEVAGFVNELDKRVITFRDKVYQGKRVAYLLKNGDWPRGYMDSKLYTSNTTGHKNITWHKYKKKIVVTLTNRNKKSCYCGVYATLKEAVEAKRLLLEKPEFQRETEL